MLRGCRIQKAHFRIICVGLCWDLKTMLLLFFCKQWAVCYGLHNPVPFRALINPHYCCHEANCGGGLVRNFLIWHVEAITIHRNDRRKRNATMLKAIALKHEECPLLCLHSTKRSKVDASELSKKIREKERMIPETSQRAKATHPKK